MSSAHRRKRKRAPLVQQTNENLLENLKPLFANRLEIEHNGGRLPNLKDRMDALNLQDDDAKIDVEHLLIRGREENKRAKKQRLNASKGFFVHEARARARDDEDEEINDDDDISMGLHRQQQRRVYPRQFGAGVLKRMREASNIDDENLSRDFKRKRVRSFDEVFTDPAPPSGMADGYARYKKIMQLLDQFVLPDNPKERLIRSSAQRTFHDAYMEAMIPTIYGSEYDKNKAAILKRHGLKKIRFFVLAMTPRRFGKTTAVAMLVAALAYVLTGVRIVIFSTGGRASKDLMVLMTKFMKQLPDGERYICKETHEEMIVGPEMLPIGKTSRSTAAQALSVDPLATVVRAYPGGRSTAGKQNN